MRSKVNKKRKIWENESGLEGNSVTAVQLSSGNAIEFRQCNRVQRISVEISSVGFGTIPLSAVEVRASQDEEFFMITDAFFPKNSNTGRSRESLFESVSLVCCLSQNS